MKYWFDFMDFASCMLLVICSISPLLALLLEWDRLKGESFEREIVWKGNHFPKSKRFCYQFYDKEWKVKKLKSFKTAHSVGEILFSLILCKKTHLLFKIIHFRLPKPRCCEQIEIILHVGKIGTHEVNRGDRSEINRQS